MSPDPWEGGPVTPETLVELEARVAAYARRRHELGGPPPAPLAPFLQERYPMPDPKVSGSAGGRATRRRADARARAKAECALIYPRRTP